MTDLQSRNFDNIEISWDLSNERLTLGGALTLRTEAELISKISMQKEFFVHISPGDNDLANVSRLFEVAFGSSELSFKPKINDKGTNLYPNLFFSRINFQESYSTLRIAQLYETFSIRPKISWKKNIEIEAENILAKYPKDSVTISLKNVESDFSGSKAEVDTWLIALRELHRLRSLSFLIVGEDNLKKSLSVDDFIFNLQEEEIDLVTQLAIISKSPIFVGTASGIAVPAIFGTNRYTIYKHPKHHVDSIKQEVTEGKFPFSQESQNIKICIPTVAEIVAETLKQLDNLQL
jgi:hypothetical protein